MGQSLTGCRRCWNLPPFLLQKGRKERSGVGWRRKEGWTGTRREQRKLNSSSVKVMKWRETFSLVYVIAVMVVFVQ